MGDRNLIDALRKGVESAWTELVDRFLKLVYHVVRRTLGTYCRQAVDQDVEDITNDLFQSLVADRFRVLGTIGPPYDLKAWLAISAKRRAIDFARRKRAGSLSLDEGEGTLEELLPARPESDPKQEAEVQAAVHDALRGLNAKERMVVQLFYLQGKKYREISRIAGIKVNSISPTLTRAVEKLQKSMKERNVASP